MKSFGEEGYFKGKDFDKSKNNLFKNLFHLFKKLNKFDKKLTLLTIMKNSSKLGIMLPSIKLN